MKKVFLCIVLMAIAGGLIFAEGTKETLSWSIRSDGKLLTASYNAWETDEGQVMVALEELKPEMIDAYSFNFDGWQITIIADGFGITSMITSSVMERDGFAADFTQAPVIKDDVLWFPIESLAALMNYKVEKDSTNKTLLLTKPETAASKEQAEEIKIKRMTSVKNNCVYPRPDIAYFEDILIPGPHGFIPARLYDPKPNDSSIKALYINIHGGGYTVGSIASSDHVCRDLANRSGQKVLSIEYGMLPEHPFPDGWEDAYAALEWAYNNSSDLGIDPDRIFVGGDSAGGTIANGIAMMARDRGEFTVAGQILAYPVIDLTASWAQFVFEDPVDAMNPYATALNADLKGMPKTMLLVAENDGLRPQGEAYAAALEQAGVQVDFSVVEGTKHGFLAVHEESREKIAQFIRTIRK